MIYNFRSICTYGRARTCVLCVGLASFLYNIPRFFEVTWENEIDEYSEENITVVAPTLLRRDPIYIRYWYTCVTDYCYGQSVKSIHQYFRFSERFTNIGVK